MAKNLIKPTKLVPSSSISPYARKTPGGARPIPLSAIIEPAAPGPPPQPDYVYTDVNGKIGAPQTTSLADLSGTTGGGDMPNGYVPAFYNEAFWGDRDALAQDVLAQYGFDNPQLTEMFGPTAGAVNYLMSFLGGDQPGEFLSAGGQAGDVDALLNQLLTPGGQSLDPGAIMAAMANADPNSPMGMMMSAMSPEDVGNMAMYLISAAGGNPLQQAGLQAMFDQSKRDYNIGVARGSDPVKNPYWQGLQTGEFSKFFPGGG